VNSSSRSIALSPEVAVVLGCVALLAVLSLPPLSGVQISIAIVGISLVVGTIAGVGYHLALHRELHATGELPRGWLWRPTDLHERLGDGARRRVLPWFVVGAAGFVGSLLGCAAFLSAVLRL
jgi:hypothetical protein